MTSILKGQLRNFEFELFGSNIFDSPMQLQMQNFELKTFLRLDGKCIFIWSELDIFQYKQSSELIYFWK